MYEHYDDDGTPLLDQHQAAKHIGLHWVKLRNRLLLTHDIKFKRIEGASFYRLDDLDAFLQRGGKLKNDKS